jgi:ubiquinone/menaquinone biosynthesis C-methylase UbiE
MEKTERNPDITTSFPILEQGEMAQELFSGSVEKPAIKELYSESAGFFAEIIKSRLSPRDTPYEMLDVGSFKGDLVRNVITELGGEYKIKATGIDTNESALAENSAVERKVVADITSMPFDDCSFDFSEARYVLIWNELDKQKEILKEINRVSKNFAIIQHAGADNENTIDWQRAMHSLLKGGVDKLKRQVCYFSSADEIENVMRDSRIIFERVQNRRVENVSQVFIEKYRLNEIEAAQSVSILGNKDYIYQTTWIIGNPR